MPLPAVVDTVLIQAAGLLIYTIIICIYNFNFFSPQNFASITGSITDSLITVLSPAITVRNGPRNAITGKSLRNGARNGLRNVAVCWVFD